VTKRKRLAVCGRIVRGTHAEAHRIEGPEGPRGAVRGLAVCGSIWACPVCSAHIRQVRAVELQEAATIWQARGGGLLMATLTLRHHRGQGLALTLDAAAKAWARLVTGAPWKRALAAYGIAGFVRSVEITWGWANGWHPHLHVLLFCEAPLTPGQQAALDAWLFDRWVSKVTAQGLAEPDREHGVVLQEAGVGAGLYVAKVQERSVALEMTRGDLKRGRSDRFLPFDLLASAGTGEALAVHLWHEYEKVTAGRKALTWSNGLRQLLDLGQQREDEEIAADDQTTDDSLLMLIPAADWRCVALAGLDYAIIEACEVFGGREEAIRAVQAVIDLATLRGS
jgi:GNAT superfamily N-acetyltransferase